MSGDVLQSHWFGLPLPEGVKAVRHWGARAIIRQDASRKPVKKKGRVVGFDTVMTTVIEMVPDRTNYRGPDIELAEAKAFFAWLDKKGMPALRKLADKMGLGPADDIEIKVDAGKYQIRANPRKSYGYLYIVAWEA